MRDFKQKTNGDLDLESGDILMTDPTLQHQRDIILTKPGAMKHNPARGVGVEEYFNDDSQEDILRKIRQEMIRDGIKVEQVSESYGKITVIGSYENNNSY